MQIMFFMDLISEIAFLSQVSGGCNRWAGDHSMSKIPIFPLLTSSCLNFNLKRKWVVTSVKISVILLVIPAHPQNTIDVKLTYQHNFSLSIFSRIGCKPEKVFTCVFCNFVVYSLLKCKGIQICIIEDILTCGVLSK